MRRDRDPALQRALATLLVVTVVLAGFGLVMLYDVVDAWSGWSVLRTQLMALALGAGGATLAVLMPYERLKQLTPLAYLVAVCLLLWVLFERPVNGARRWIELAGFRFQPSDLAKLALLMALARYGASPSVRITTLKGGVLYPGLLVGPVAALILLEPDFGTTVLLVLTAIVVLIVAGLPRRWILVGALAVLLLGSAGIQLSTMRVARLYSWLHLQETKEDLGYQAWQARIAIASGGLTGVGFSRSTQWRFIPECENDFIFAIVAEEYGLVGSAALMTAYLALLWSGITVARRAVDRFGTLLATGITFLLTGQALCNMAVVSGALPNKGLTLPFISQGGSSLMMTCLMVGVLLRIGRTRQDEGPWYGEPMSLFPETVEEGSL